VSGFSGSITCGLKRVFDFGFAAVASADFFLLSSAATSFATATVRAEAAVLLSTVAESDLSGCCPPNAFLTFRLIEGVVACLALSSNPTSVCGIDVPTLEGAETSVVFAGS
jgi:hypothetical protein